MEDFFFGGGWLDDLLREARGQSDIKEKVRQRVRALEEEGKGRYAEVWRSVDELLRENLIGKALEKAMKSVSSLAEELGNALGDKKAALEKPFSPFLIKAKEIKKVIHPSEDLEELILSRDDLDAVISLEMINDARRLLASWGTGVWGEEPLKLIPRLEEDLEELRKCQSYLMEVEEEDFGDEYDEKEVELADKVATLATRFALDLLDLHLQNARNPEVGMRFRLLWNTVRQLEESKNISAAAFEALQVFEEALDLAGLGGGELLARVDLLYERFSDAEELRRAVDHLVNVTRNGEGSIRADQGRDYIQAIANALGDLGLDVA
jgi:hypothetical protein